ncbi:allantoate deiminase [Bryocella elongata]|uniref:Allantoate deiminase n=1 Tax=Bryocella elongata TaxID=863522 RepID=A0A1H5WHM5_9BACT|nr:allantoate amidohydrolase [Bryocella elongata]SEF98840.1 allantoate deiminase [Bryocella elongata]
MSNAVSPDPTTRAAKIITRCRELARITDIPGETTRLFLSPATSDAHTLISWWMRQAGLESRTDDAGNLRAVRRSGKPDAPTLVLFSHIDTVPNAGAFDGPLGVLLGLAAIEELGATALPFHIELIAFAEEEGARFGFPFLSSLAVVGKLDAAMLDRKDKQGISVAEAIRSFGLDPTRIPETCPLAPSTFAAIEVHIEQGPVLEKEDASLAVVEAIVGQSRFELTFEGQANHAGTTPMALRHDALVAAAQWIVEVEQYAANYKQLVATVGRVDAYPGATNIVPAKVHATLDVRHPKDESRHAAVAHLLTKAESSATHRGVKVSAKAMAEQKAVNLDRTLTTALHRAAERAGFDAEPMFSGAGHDSMILAPHVPTTMLFVRSPRGLSHHPDENVREEDVEAALATLLNLLIHLHPHKISE